MKSVVYVALLLVSANFALYAQNKADSLIGVLNTNNLAANEQLMLYQHIYRDLMRSNPEKALPYAEKGLALAEKENSKKDMVIFNKALGISHMHFGRYDTSRHCFNKALDMAKKMDDRESQASILMELGILYGVEDNNETTLEYLLKAQSICDTANTDGVYASILCNIGTVCRLLDDKTRAVHYLEQAKTLTEKSKDTVTLPHIYHQLASIYYEQNKLDPALEYGLKSIEITRRADMKELTGAIAGLLAKVYQTKFNDNDKALEYARECVRQTEASGNPRAIKGGLTDLAYIYRLQKRWKECEATSMAVLDADTAFRDIRLSAIENLVVTSIYLDKKDRAVSFLNQYNSLINVQNRQNYRKTQMNLDIKYEIEKKDIEHRILQQAHDRQSSLLLFLAAALALIASLSVMLTVFYRKSAIHNRELENLHRIKDKLFSVIAHDLRSPVSALMSLLELTKTSRFDHNMWTLMVSDISNRVNGMYGMIDNLLRWAKSQMQGIAAHPKTFDVQAESRAVTDVLEDIAGKKGIALRNHIAKQHVYADRDMFAVTVQNLTMNAIKYTAAEGAVTLSSELLDNMLVISVKDTGMGMTPEVQKKLFDLTATQSRRGTANEIGTGLGLTLCSDFVKANGGSIWFKSAPGKGSTFSFNVPVSVPN